MRLTVLGGCGGWPAAGLACSGYLVEHDGFRLLVDPGFATTPILLEHLDAHELDAVYVSHAHPDHCADLNPLLRARVLSGHPGVPPLQVYALPNALDAVLALEPAPGMYPPPDLAALLDCEEQAGRTDPYRQVAALLHVIARKEAELCG